MTNARQIVLVSPALSVSNALGVPPRLSLQLVALYLDRESDLGGFSKLHPIPYLYRTTFDECSQCPGQMKCTL